MKCWLESKYLFKCFLAGPGHAPTAPHFDSRSRIFELDSCGGNGKVCLAYKNCTPGIGSILTNLNPNKLFICVRILFFSIICLICAFSRCRSPAEWNLVPWPLTVLAFSDCNLHLLLSTHDNPPRSAWVALCLHPIWPQSRGQGRKVSYLYVFCKNFQCCRHFFFFTQIDIFFRVNILCFAIQLLSVISMIQLKFKTQT